MAAARSQDSWDLWGQLSSLCEPMQVPQQHHVAQEQYGPRGTLTPRAAPAYAPKRQAARERAPPQSQNGNQMGQESVEDVLNQHLHNTPNYGRTPNFSPPAQHQEVQYRSASSRMSTSSQVLDPRLSVSASRILDKAALEAASAPFPKALDMDGSYRDMYKEVNSNLYNDRYPRTMDVASRAGSHPSVPGRGANSAAGRRFQGIEAGQVEHLDLGSLDVGKRVESIDLGYPAGGLKAIPASPPDFGSSGNLIDPQPFQGHISMPKVLSTQPVFSSHAHDSANTKETVMATFFLVRKNADTSAPMPTQRAALPFRTEAVVLRGNDPPPPPTWVDAELASVLSRTRAKTAQGWVQHLEDGAVVALPEAHAVAVGTREQHRVVRTRMRWPVPITVIEERVLVNGVRAYVNQHQALPASISELLAYCD